MANYAIIQNGKVSNVLLADDAFIAANYPGSPRIDTLNPVPGIGWLYASGTFTAPASSVPVPVTSFTRFGFRALFTLQELIGVDNYASNTGLNSTQMETLNTITKNFDAAETIDLSDPATQYGVNYLVSCGLLTQARATTILAGLAPS